MSDTRKRDKNFTVGNLFYPSSSSVLERAQLVGWLLNNSLTTDWYLHLKWFFFLLSFVFHSSRSKFPPIPPPPPLYIIINSLRDISPSSFIYCPTSFFIKCVSFCLGYFSCNPPHIHSSCILCFKLRLPHSHSVFIKL